MHYLSEVTQGSSLAVIRAARDQLLVLEPSGLDTGVRRRVLLSLSLLDEALRDDPVAVELAGCVDGKCANRWCSRCRASAVRHVQFRGGLPR